MQNQTLFKMAAQFVAAVGVTKVISDIISNNTNPQTTADVVKIWTGSFVLGSMITEQATNHVVSKIDQLQNWNEARKEAAETAS